MNCLQSIPHLRRLPCLRSHSQRLVVEYLRFLSARHYSPKTIQATVGMLKTFCMLLPTAHQMPRGIPLPPNYSMRERRWSW
jgi:hypothetical protein